jgi:hypothetical protein
MCSEVRTEVMYIMYTNVGFQRVSLRKNFLVSKFKKSVYSFVPFYVLVYIVVIIL